MSFGRGAIRTEQIGWGVPRSESADRFDTALELVRELLVHGQIDAYDTPWWKGGAITIVPEPTQLPHPPIWLAAVSEGSSYKAGRLGLHLATVFRDNKERAESLVSYRRGWEEFAGSNPQTPLGKVSSLHHVFVAETRASSMGSTAYRGLAFTFLKIISDHKKTKTRATRPIVRQRKILASSRSPDQTDGRCGTL